MWGGVGGRGGGGWLCGGVGGVGGGGGGVGGVTHPCHRVKQKNRAITAQFLYFALNDYVGRLHDHTYFLNGHIVHEKYEKYEKYEKIIPCALRNSENVHCHAEYHPAALPGSSVFR